MAYRILTAAAVLVALAAPALAQNTAKYETTVSCYSHSSRSSRSGNWTNCTRETKVTPPPQPSKPNCAYLPNFGSDPRCR